MCQFSVYQRRNQVFLIVIVVTVPVASERGNQGLPNVDVVCHQELNHATLDHNPAVGLGFLLLSDNVAIHKKAERLLKAVGEEPPDGGLALGRYHATEQWVAAIHPS